ncbi:MAG: LiaI-LiaF-like domain-containing protein [Candidatus Aminicenantales bacterium]
MAKHKRRDTLAWGLILIVIGLLFLLHNINISVWDSIARLWPVVLIVWGLWKLYFGIKESREKTEGLQD